MTLLEIFLQVVLPVVVSNVFALYIFVLKDRSDRPNKTITAQDALQKTVDNLANQNREFVVELSLARKEISELRSGMIIVIGQLEAAGIKPLWKPDWMNGHDDKKVR